MISGIWPSQGETDTRVRISGANFGNSQGTVSFGGSSAPIESWTSGTIVALVPLYPPMGPVEVTVTVPGNTQPSNPVNFTVTGNPFNRDPEECEDGEECEEEGEEDEEGEDGGDPPPDP